MNLVHLGLVPELPAEPASVDSAAVAIRASTSGVSEAGADVTKRWGDLSAVYDAPETQSAVTSLASIDDAASEWSIAAVAVADALDTYADALAGRKREIDALTQEIPSFRAAVASFQAGQRELYAQDGEEIPEYLLYDPAHRAYNTDLIARCHQVSSLLEVAADSCRRDLAAVSAPSTHLPPAASADPFASIGAPGIENIDTAFATAILGALVRSAGEGVDADAVAAFLAAHPDYVEAIATGAPDPLKIASWWQTEAVPGSALALALIAGAPLVVGSLNGVPANDRVAANKYTAADRLARAREELENTPERTGGRVPHSNGLARAELEAEIAYLEQVTSGERTLYLYDPSRQRIIEMIGDPATATYTITYVPGTGTQMSSYYGGGVQSVSQYLVDQDAGSTVAFVYTDGPWASWGLPGQQTSNANKDFAFEEGAQLARFEDGLRADANLAAANHVGIAHSAGMSILSSAEVNGARYDQVSSLGGSWLQDGWSAENDTDYDHHQYGFDAINYLNPFYDTANESSNFAQHSYTPSSFLGIQNELDNHIRVAEGPERNSEVLFDLHGEIHD